MKYREKFFDNQPLPLNFLGSLFRGITFGNCIICLDETEFFDVDLGCFVCSDECSKKLMTYLRERMKTRVR